MKSRAAQPHSIADMRVVQIVFVCSVFLLFLTGLIDVGSRIIAQLPTNQNLSGFMWWILPGFVVPIVLVLLAYLTRKSKALNLQAIFDIALVVVTSNMAADLVASVTSTVVLRLGIVMEGYLPFFIIYSAVPATVSLTMLIIFIIALRRSGRW